MSNKVETGKLTRSEEIKVLERQIKRDFSKHLKEIGYRKESKNSLQIINCQKEGIRLLHKNHRRDKLISEQKFIQENHKKLITYFASGDDIVPEKIKPRLELVESRTTSADIFRFASLTWSVPVSNGFGRRLRFLVWDDQNNKLIGLIALGDPVFNLRARDERIGWSSKDRVQRLVNILDAYVLGAVPPYNSLLGGKLVASLIRTKEIRDIFASKYGQARGLISGKKKRACLVGVTTSSSLGRSSVYNRLRLEGISYLEPLGYTSGWGHFHVSDELFEKMRRLLILKKHSYASNHGFGQGPNWRMRAIKVALEMIGLDPELCRHGVEREVFLCSLASNVESYLTGSSKRPNYSNLSSLDAVANLALNRWVIPRAIRNPEYKLWKTSELLDLLGIADNKNVKKKTYFGNVSARAAEAPLFSST